MPLRTQSLAAMHAGAQPRCLSVCHPSHRRLRDSRRVSIRYRNLMKQLERSSQQSLEAAVANFLEPFDALEHDVEYWSKTLKAWE